MYVFTDSLPIQQYFVVYKYVKYSIIINGRYIERHNEPDGEARGD